MDLTGLSSAARRQIERVRAVAELAFMTANNEPAADPVLIVVRLFGPPDPSDTVAASSGTAPLDEPAITYALTIFHAIVEAVRSDAILPTRARSLLDRLWHELLTDIVRDKHPYDPAERPFVARAAEARLQAPWWQTFQVALLARLETPPTFGQQLKAWMDDAGLKPADLVRETGFDRKTVDAHLNDDAMPRPDNVDVYESVCARHGHPVKFEIPPRKSRHS